MEIVHEVNSKTHANEKKTKGIQTKLLSLAEIYVLSAVICSIMHTKIHVTLTFNI